MPKGGKVSRKAKQKAKQKAKKEARKAALAEEKLKVQIVHDAKFGADGGPKNVLADFPPFQKFDRNGLQLQVEFAAASNVGPADIDWMLACTRDNMQELYEDGGWGWNDVEKRRELVDEDARHLLVRTAASSDESKDGESTPGELVAFCHFRFMLEDLYPVLYVQEIQLTPAVQRCGLGKQLMQTLELIARKNKMQWVMLTVFKDNEAAVQFYMKKLKYTIDNSSPDMHYADAEYSYLILSKCVDKALAKQIEEERLKEAAEDVKTREALLAAALGNK